MLWIWKSYLVFLGVERLHEGAPQVGEKWSTIVNEAQGVDPVHRQKLLAWGVSCEGEGRAAYAGEGAMRCLWPIKWKRFGPLMTEI